MLNKILSMQTEPIKGIFSVTIDNKSNPPFITIEYLPMNTKIHVATVEWKTLRDNIDALLKEFRDASGN